MTLFWNGLRDFPGTQAKVFVGVCLEVLTVLAMLYVLVAGKTANMNLEFVITMCGFVLGANGVTTWQYKVNRNNDPDVIAAKAQGPSPVTVENIEQVDVPPDAVSKAPMATGVARLMTSAPPSRTPQPLTHRESEKD